MKVSCEQCECHYYKSKINSAIKNRILYFKKYKQQLFEDWFAVNSGKCFFTFLLLWDSFTGFSSILILPRLQDRTSSLKYFEYEGAKCSGFPSWNISLGGLRLSQLQKSSSHVVMQVISGFPSQSLLQVLPKCVFAHPRVAEDAK